MYSSKRIKRSPQFASQALVAQTPRYDESKLDDGYGSFPRPQFVPQQQEPITLPGQDVPMMEPQLDQTQTLINRLSQPLQREEVPIPAIVPPSYRQLQFQYSPYAGPEVLDGLSGMNLSNMMAANSVLDQMQGSSAAGNADALYKNAINPMLGGLLGMFGMKGARQQQFNIDKQIMDAQRIRDSQYDNMNNLSARRMQLAKMAYDQQQDYDPYTIANQRARAQAEGYMNQVMNSQYQGYNRALMDRYNAQVKAQDGEFRAEHQNNTDLLNALRLRDSGRRMDMQERQYQEKVRQWEEKVNQFNRTFGLKQDMEAGRNSRFDKGEAGKSARQGVSEAGKNSRQQRNIDARVDHDNQSAENSFKRQQNAQEYGAQIKGKSLEGMPVRQAPTMRLNSEQQNVREQQVAFAQDYKSRNPKADMNEIRAAWLKAKR